MTILLAEVYRKTVPVTPLSNWSVVEEIKRLIEINSIQDVEPDYQFHKEGCSEEESTPFNEPKQFYKGEK